MDYNGKVFIITEASSAAARNAAQYFGLMGASIALVDSDWQKLNEVVNMVSPGGSLNIQKITLNVTTEAQSIVNRVIDEFQRIDVVIHNMYIDRTPIFNVDDFDQIMQHSVRSMIEFTSLCLPFLTETKGSVVLILHDISTNDNKRSMVRDAIEAFVHSTARDWHSKGIRINAINLLRRAESEATFGGGSRKSDLTNADTLMRFLQYTRNEYRPIETGDPISLDISDLVQVLASNCSINGTIVPIEYSGLK